jgi:hypothetical protein
LQPTIYGFRGKKNKIKALSLIPAVFQRHVFSLPMRGPYCIHLSSLLSAVYLNTLDVPVRRDGDLLPPDFPHFFQHRFVLLTSGEIGSLVSIFRQVKKLFKYGGPPSSGDSIYSCIQQYPHHWNWYSGSYPGRCPIAWLLRCCALPKVRAIHSTNTGANLFFILKTLQIILSLFLHLHIISSERFSFTIYEPRPEFVMSSFHRHFKCNACTRGLGNNLLILFPAN